MSAEPKDGNINDISLKPSKDVGEVNKRLQELRLRKVHLIGPGVKSLLKLETIPSGWEVNWHGFGFDPSPTGHDFYADRRWKGGVIAFKREALLTMWNAAGGRTLYTAREDDGRDPNYVLWKYGGSVQDFTGNWIPEMKVKEMDLREGSEDAKVLGTSGMLTQQRHDIVSLAESKAQNRVIRALLGISHTYTPEEATRPFVLMRLVLVPNMADPLTRALVLANSFGAMNALFGNTDNLKMLLSAGTAEPDTAEETGRLLAPVTMPEQRKLEAKPPDTPTGNAQSKEDRLLDFKSADATQQLVILVGMMKKKNFTADKLNKPLEAFTEKNRVELFKHLLELADVEGADDEPAFKL